MSFTAQDRSSMDQPLQKDDLEEIFNLDPAVLKQLLDELLEPRQHNLVEEPPQHKLVDVDNETIARGWIENCVKPIESLKNDTRIRICQISEAIQNLPPELSEKIYKEFVKIKMKERKEMGWKEVRDDIEDAPFCEKRLRITKVLFCFKCKGCQRNGLCELCRKNGESHNLGYTTYDLKDFDEIFIKAY